MIRIVDDVAEHQFLGFSHVEGQPWKVTWECSCGVTGIATKRVLGESWNRSVRNNFKGHVRRATTGASK